MGRPGAARAWSCPQGPLHDPHHQDIAFGLCDLGLGHVELGSVSLAELRAYRGRFGHRVERDLHFKAEHPISVYARAGRDHERMVTEHGLLQRAAAKGGVQ